VAPSLRPSKPGARVPTDRRDAGPLARLARAGAFPAASSAGAQRRQGVRTKAGTPRPPRPRCRGPGRIVLSPRAGDLCPCDWPNSPQCSRTAVGRPRVDWGNAPGDASHAVRTPRGHRGHGPGAARMQGGHGPGGAGRRVSPRRCLRARIPSPTSTRQGALAAAPPRCGGTRGGVRRLGQATRA
jgi:hypothetical protein